jgi:nucleoside-diphosphate-sugar epimerase
MSTKPSISILGCGWLGLPLAGALVHNGYQIKGSTTTEQKLSLLEEKQIKPYLIDLSAKATLAALPAFLQSVVLILNIPPKLRTDGGAAYLEQIRVLLKALSSSPVEKIIFVSSTSVVPDLNRLVNEDDVPPVSEDAPGDPLLYSEHLIQRGGDWQTTIVRFGGLVGGKRHPGRFLAGKTEVPNPDAPVNLIHLHDCIRIIMQILDQDLWGTDYLACADEHPSRREFYTRAALLSGLTPPLFLDAELSSFKIVSNRKLKEELNFTFSYPDPYMMISGQVPSEV